LIKSIIEVTKRRWTVILTNDIFPTRQFLRFTNPKGLAFQMRQPFFLIGQVLPYCLREGIGVIVYSPMASGLLTGAMTRERAAKLPKDDWRKNHPDFTEPNLTRNLALVERLQEIARRHNRSAGEVAIAWVLHHPAVTGAIVGARNARQAKGVMRAGNLRLTDEEVNEIEAFFAETAA
jgi:aryl-alcohol dehydrogenase-like predicted oxidoreductase